jgi:hypothetical protein
MLGAALAGSWIYWGSRVEPLALQPRSPLPAPGLRDGRLELRLPAGALVAEVARYRDELFAYLMFAYYRHSTPLREVHLMLTCDPGSEPLEYVVQADAGDGILRGLELLARLHQAGLASPDWRLVDRATLDRFERQTRVFVSAYNLPTRRKMEQIPASELAVFMRRLLRFKSNTDPRVRRRIEPVPRILSQDEAQRLAADILTVADFYELPLEFFLGIGAMENNYMEVRGDLDHTIWKKRPAPDDVVVERRRGRVRVLNDSAGVWQITRETLRFAHRQYQRDQRDYSKLPEHLRPPAELNVQEVQPGVLTTYAGLLFRDLLDRFEGDVTRAVGAYNGGPGNPNLRYAAGVEAAAQHARRVLEQLAVLNGESVLEQRWILSR